MPDSEILSGGNSNEVRREGNTVLRKMGAWSPFVHALLNYLTANGFTQAPRLIEQRDGYERLSFVAGEVGHYPLQPYMQTDAVVVEAAQWLRRFHDLTEHFVMPPHAEFWLPPAPLGHAEVICHNDFAPYNCVFDNPHLVGVIDFDSASPGPRLWDIAYAVYRFAPLVADEHCRAMGWITPPDRAARLRLFCDAYGLDSPARGDLLPLVRRRIEALMQFMRDTASNLDHLPTYQRDLDYLQAHQAQLIP